MNTKLQQELVIFIESGKFKKKMQKQERNLRKFVSDVQSTPNLERQLTVNQGTWISMHSTSITLTEQIGEETLIARLSIHSTGKLMIMLSRLHGGSFNLFWQEQRGWKLLSSLVRIWTKTQVMSCLELTPKTLKNGLNRSTWISVQCGVSSNTLLNVVKTILNLRPNKLLQLVRKSKKIKRMMRTMTTRWQISSLWKIQWRCLSSFTKRMRMMMRKVMMITESS